MTESKNPASDPEDSAPSTPPSTPPAAEDIRAETDSKVGYGRPPKQHRFQKGKSGNPRGRPKKVKPSQDSIDMRAILTKVLTETVRVPIDGKIVEMTAFEAVARTGVLRAIRGPKGMGEMMALIKLAPPFHGERDVHGREIDPGAWVRERIEKMALRIEEQRRIEAEEAEKAEKAQTQARAREAR